jgi:hypothetical protein
LSLPAGAQEEPIEDPSNPKRVLMSTPPSRRGGTRRKSHRGQSRSPPHSP